MAPAILRNGGRRGRHDHEVQGGDDEDVLAAEEVGEGGAREIDGAEVESALHVVRAALPADRVERLEPQRAARLRCVLLASEIGDAGDVHLRSAHRLVQAGAAAGRIERADDLIAAGDLHSQIVVEPRRERDAVHAGDHPVAAVERAGTAARRDAAERLDVLVQLVSRVGANGEAVRG